MEGVIIFKLGAEETLHVLYSFLISQILHFLCGQISLRIMYGHLQEFGLKFRLNDVMLYYDVFSIRNVLLSPVKGVHASCTIFTPLKKLFPQ